MDQTIMVTSRRRRRRRRCRSRHSCRRHRWRSTVGWTKSSYIVAPSAHYNNCMHGTLGSITVVHRRSHEPEVEAVPQESARNFERRISRVTAISRLRLYDDNVQRSREPRARMYAKQTVLCENRCAKLDEVSFDVSHTRCIIDGVGKENWGRLTRSYVKFD